MKTLYAYVTDWLVKQGVKHDLGEHYVEETLNKMSNYEFLQALSDAFDEMAKDAVEEQTAASLDHPDFAELRRFKPIA